MYTCISTHTHTHIHTQHTHTHTHTQVSLSCFLPVTHAEAQLKQEMKKMWEASRTPQNAAEFFEVT